MIHPFILRKLAFVDPSMMQGQMGGGAMPMDPSMMQGQAGAMPMDPSMMQAQMGGGGMPMDPAMMQAQMGGGAMPMDPSMMQGQGQPTPADVAAAMQGGGGGGAMPGGDVEMLKQVIREVLEEMGVGKKKGGEKEELNAKLDEILQSLRMLLNVQGLGGMVPPPQAPSQPAGMEAMGPTQTPPGGMTPTEEPGKMASDNVKQFFNKVNMLQRSLQRLR